MPTRFYLPSSSGAPDISPAIDGAWDSNTGSPSRVQLVRSPSGTSMAAVGPISEGTAAQAYNVFFRQYISGPLAAQEISGTVAGLIRAVESNAAADASGQLVIRVVSGDGSTVRGTLYGGLTSTGSNPTGEFSTTSGSRNFPGPGSVSLTPVEAQEGDRLVVEIGSRNQNTTTTNYTTTITFGDNASGDFTVAGSTLTTLNPWIEFSQDILPAPVGTMQLGVPTGFAGSTGISASVNVSGGYTVHAGSDRLLVVGTGVASASRRVTGVSYNGVAMTLLDQGIDVAADSDGAKFWYLINPPAGNHTLTIQANGTNTSLIVIALSVSGVDQTTPLGTPTTGGSTTANTQPSISVDTSSANELVVDVLYARNWGMVPGSGQTELAERTLSGNPHTLAMSYEAGTGSAVTMDWTVPTTFNFQSQVGVAVRPAPDVEPPEGGPNRRRRAYAS